MKHFYWGILSLSFAFSAYASITTYDATMTFTATPRGNTTAGTPIPGYLCAGHASVSVSTFPVLAGAYLSDTSATPKWVSLINNGRPGSTVQISGPAAGPFTVQTSSMSATATAAACTGQAARTFRIAVMQ